MWYDIELVNIPFLNISESSAKKQKRILVKKIFKPWRSLLDLVKSALSLIRQSNNLPIFSAALMSAKFSEISVLFSLPISGKKKSKFLDNSLISISKVWLVLVSIDNRFLKSVLFFFVISSFDKLSITSWTSSEMFVIW